jgi:hypothetical protein
MTASKTQDETFRPEDAPYLVVASERIFQTLSKISLNNLAEARMHICRSTYHPPSQNHCLVLLDRRELQTSLVRCLQSCHHQNPSLEAAVEVLYLGARLVVFVLFRPAAVFLLTLEVAGTGVHPILS